MASPTSLKLGDELKAASNTWPKSVARSSHWIMREAIEQYMEREEKREALRGETLKAWDEFQATGLHVTADEVEKWLSTWGADDEQRAAPGCHK